MDNVAGLDGEGRFEQTGEEGHELLQLVGRHPDDNEPKPETAQLVLKLQAAVDRQQDVELPFGEKQQLAVRNAAPSGFGNRFHGVAGERCANPGVDALV